jgi:MerR family transcriptional regulator, thiopeptide resistance regulator
VSPGTTPRRPGRVVARQTPPAWDGRARAPLTLTSRLDAVRGALDDAIEALEKGTEMDADDLFEVFGDFEPSRYDDEVERRWGGTEAYAESARRTAAYGKADWQAIKAEAAEITAAFVAALDAGRAPGDPVVQAIVARHWGHLERWFYNPTPQLYAGLADLYLDDPRFTKNIDKARVGLAAYQRAAMRVYAVGESA